MSIFFVSSTLHFLVYVFIVSLPLSTSSKDEKRLIRDLFDDYDRSVRPVLDSSETVTVAIKHTLSQILNVEERNELFVTSGWCSLRWRDQYLNWNPRKYGGIKELNLSPERVWIPDIMLYDDFNSNKVFGSHSVSMTNLILIDYNGNVIWGLKATFITKCHLEIYHFPFDTQQCHFRYGSWSYESKRIGISNRSRIQYDHHATGNGWNILGLATKIDKNHYNTIVYDAVEFTVIFKRKIFLVSVNLILPPLIIGTLNLHSFVLPAASGERLALSITLLLAMIFFIINVIDVIPNDNERIPIIYRFFVATLGEIVLQIIVIIFGMQLYHKKSSDPPIPRWTRFIILDNLAYWSGVRVDVTYYYPPKNRYSLKPEEMEALIDIGFLSQHQYSFVEKQQATCVKHDSYLQTCAEDDEQLANEWRIVALTVDRCVFIVFGTVWLITVVAFFVTVTSESDARPLPHS